VKRSVKDVKRMIGEVERVLPDFVDEGKTMDLLLAEGMLMGLRWSLGFSDKQLLRFTKEDNEGIVNDFYTG